MMKMFGSFFKIGAVAALAAGLLVCLAAGASAQITGSVHDFSGYGWSGGEICVVCHTPHHANTTGSAEPLWNHEVSTATYTLYTSSTLDATLEQPGGVSKLCLSCHDGTVALDSYDDRTGSDFISAGKNIGTDISNDHPVSFVWQHQTITSGMCMKCHFTTEKVHFYNENRVECGTCHDVHNSFPANGKLLRYTMAGSQLCLVCHEK